MKAGDIIAGRVQGKRYSSFREFAADMEKPYAKVI
jgi:hypothetical protein